LRGEQEVSWLGLTPVTDKHWTLVPLGLDLYDGLPGVALFLAYLGRISGEGRYTALARVALATMQCELKHIRSSVQMSEAQQIGGFTGWGGILYVLAHLGTLWEQSSLFSEAEGIVELLPSLIERDEQFDLIAGSAGCIASLLALYRCAPSPAIVAAATQCGNHLISHAVQLSQGIGWLAKAIFPKPLSGFSHGAAGIAWALHELSALTSDERFSRAASAGIAYERSLFVREQANWLDLRDLQPSGKTTAEAPANFGNAWCHGAPGIGLGRMLCLKRVHDSEIQEEIDAALRTTLAQGFGGNHSLCHGDLGNLETLLEASLRMKASHWQGEVYRLAGLILESIEQNGWLCGNPVTVEAPGLMTGLAGIGYELLRLADPVRVPSVLALAPPFWRPAEATRESNASAAAVLVS
jgi:type 2 lantibiotic biosynthesis protein LanM